MGDVLSYSFHLGRNKNKSKSNMQNQNSSLPIKYEFDVANVMKSFLKPNK